MLWKCQFGLNLSRCSSCLTCPDIESIKISSCFLSYSAYPKQLDSPVSSPHLCPWVKCKVTHHLPRAKSSGCCNSFPTSCLLCDVLHTSSSSFLNLSTHALLDFWLSAWPASRSPFMSASSLSKRAAPRFLLFLSLLPFSPRIWKRWLHIYLLCHCLSSGPVHLQPDYGNYLLSSLLTATFSPLSWATKMTSLKYNYKI